MCTTSWDGVSRVPRTLDVGRAGQDASAHPAPEYAARARGCPGMSTATTVTRNDAASRYELHEGETLLAVLDYRDNGTAVSLTRAFTVPAHRGQGHAATVTAGAVEDIEARGGAAGGRQVVPMCWYVAQWFDEHAERAHLLAPR